MSIFKKCFLLINEDEKNIEKKVTYNYVSAHSYRKEKKEQQGCCAGGCEVM